MDKVVIIRRVDEGEVELLRVRVARDEAPVVALVVFEGLVTATDYIDLTEGLGAEDGWLPVEIELGDLVAICEAFGIDYVALPSSPGLGQAGVGPVLEVVAALERQ